MSSNTVDGQPGQGEVTGASGGLRDARDVPERPRLTPQAGTGDSPSGSDATGVDGSKAAGGQPNKAEG